MLTVIDIEWQILMNLKLSGFKVMSCFGDHTKTRGIRHPTTIENESKHMEKYHKSTGTHTQVPQWPVT